MDHSSDNPLAPGTHDLTFDELGGIRQRYHVHGSGPVCMVHPGGPGFSWEYLRMPALEEFLTLVYVEPVGTGGSGRLAGHPHGYTRDVYAQALDALIVALDAGRVSLLGHSHGAFVAQHYAREHSERLAGLVLYESAPVTGPEHFAEAVRNLDRFAADHAGDPGLQDVLDAWQSVPAIADDAAFTMAARRLFPVYFADYWGHQDAYASVLESISGSYISGLDDCMAPTAIDDRSALESITTPTLVIVGRHDFICGPRWAGEIHERIPRSTLLVLEDSGHFGHIEEPEVLTRKVADFVTSADAAA
ncbi:alpha/beta fold hydrolase [Streptomyces sp. NPDC001068]|uniref:alpha/beta fold hydrolase n=1 Tax=Streptomyces sp. NPDC001068 TaxID=3364544 RepID=UPI0036769C2F